jgi:hypothetical protein
LLNNEISINIALINIPILVLIHLSIIKLTFLKFFLTILKQEYVDETINLQSVSSNQQNVYIIKISYSFMNQSSHYQYKLILNKITINIINFLIIINKILLSKHHMTFLWYSKYLIKILYQKSNLSFIFKDFLIKLESLYNSNEEI